jgi:ATP-dependent Clp protease adaptor protein ClpS
VPVILPDLSTDVRKETRRPVRVILYNDDWHSFDDVIRQLMKAIHCSAEEGERHAWIVHTQGRSLVFEGKREDCEVVAGILREIRLQVEVDWD